MVAGRAFCLNSGNRSTLVLVGLSSNDRSMASAEMVKFLADPGASLQRADTQYLQQGNTCTLWVTRVDGRRLVVKFYNITWLRRVSVAHSARRAQRRDLGRFMRNREACPGIKAMFTEMMQNKNRVTES